MNLSVLDNNFYPFLGSVAGALISTVIAYHYPEMMRRLDRFLKNDKKSLINPYVYYLN
jgi:hypothetical protein